MPGGGAMNSGPAAPADAAAQERLLCRPVPAIAAEIESATGRSAMPYGVRGLLGRGERSGRGDVRRPGAPDRLLLLDVLMTVPELGLVRGVPAHLNTTK